MRLWTHHPEAFQLNDADLRIDPTMGKYWQYQATNFRYREVLPILIKLIGTDQFIWCCTVRGQFKRTTSKKDLVEWELDVPAPQILAFYRASVWDGIVWNRSPDWDGLFVDISQGVADTEIHALVRIPIRREWAICHGQLPIKYPHRAKSARAVSVD